LWIEVTGKSFRRTIGPFSGPSLLSTHRRAAISGFPPVVTGDR